MKFLRGYSGIIFLLLLLLLPAVLPLFREGFFQSDDGEWMVIRFSAFHQALADGQFPVRFLHRLNYGYGYPVANFLYPGFMYLGETLKLLGFSFVDVIKITLGITLLESSIFTYLWLRFLFGKLPAFIGALVYLYTPYHLFDVYKRGSVGETLALATVPFILWQIERKSLLWASCGIALLVLSHNTLALLFLPIIFIYGLLRKGIIRYTLYPIFFGFGLSAFFWVPALYDLQYTVFYQTKVSEWEQYFSDVQLIGFSTIFIIASTCIYLFKKSKKKDFLYILFLSIGIVSIFMSSAVSSMLWNILPVSFVQFPFRFLSVTLVSVSFLTSFLLSQFSKKTSSIFIGVIVVFLAVSAKPYAAPLEYFDKADALYATNEATTTVQDEYMPHWVKKKPTEHFKNKVEVLEGKGKIENLIFNNKKINFDAVMQNNGKARVNTVYFPGWEAKLDGRNTEIFYSNEKGVMEIIIPSGNHKVQFTFTETPIRIVSDGISLLSFLALFFVVTKTKKYFNKK